MPPTMQRAGHCTLLLCSPEARPLVIRPPRGFLSLLSGEGTCSHSASCSHLQSGRKVCMSLQPWTCVPWLLSYSPTLTTVLLKLFPAYQLNLAPWGHWHLVRDPPSLGSALTSIMLWITCSLTHEGEPSEAANHCTASVISLVYQIRIRSLARASADGAKAAFVLAARATCAVGSRILQTVWAVGKGTNSLSVWHSSRFCTSLITRLVQLFPLLCLGSSHLFF